MTREEQLACLEDRPCSVCKFHTDGCNRWTCVFEDEPEGQEPCEDAISRQAVLDIINFEDKWLLDAKGHNADTEIAFSGMKSRIAELPSVNPQPKTGHWTRVSMDKYVQHAMAFYRCSECGKDIIGEHNFCPNCGCRMVEPKESEE